MSRPVSIQEETILAEARKVFLRQGYKASTVQIARQAGISEGSLFKHFKTKTDLFLAAMDAEFAEATLQEQLMRSVGTGDIRKMLESAGIEILERLKIVLPRVMMIRSSGIVLTGHRHGRTFRLLSPIHKVRALARYFRAETKQGRLIMQSPEVHAQFFVATLSHYVVQEILFGFRTASPKVYVRTVVDLILRATAPKEENQFLKHKKTGSQNSGVRIQNKDK